MKTCLAIRHVAFEHLGTIGPALAAAGYQARMIDAGSTAVPAETCDDLVVVLGGPIGACDDAEYPFLAEEIRLIERRLVDDRPVLGICLGAQLLARAMGAHVSPSRIREIGWSELSLTVAGRTTPLATLAGQPVLHWHGDVFDLPAGAAHLASSMHTPHQAFAAGRSLGLQFHAEVDADEIEHWLIGHAVEIATAGLSPTDIRLQARQHGGALKAAARTMFADWLTTIASPAHPSQPGDDQ